MPKEEKEQNNKRRPAVFLCVLSCLLFAVAVLLARALSWEQARWSNLKLNELYNQLATPVEGTGGVIMDSFIKSCVLFTAVLVIVAIAACVLFKGRGRRLFSGALLVFSLSLLAVTFVRGNESLGIIDYYRALSENSDYIQNNYADPAKTRIDFPEKKKNLVYIWLESMETTYSDKEHGGAFDRDVISCLSELGLEGDSFTGGNPVINGGYSLSGSTWTMGALFAHTAGLPLRIPITDSSMSSQDSFFPGVTALGDILEKEGYRQVFMIGSDAVFGGRARYFTDHGNFEILDYKEALAEGKIPEGYSVWWGFEDEKLFQFAREELTKLAEGDEPFNLMMLTVDTHFADGYVCRLCGNEFDDQYSNVLACSAKQIMDFVRWIQAQDFYGDTVIVLAGDHITMQVGYCDEVQDVYERRAFATILNAAADESGGMRCYSTMDLFPTTVEALGAKIEGGRLGLGTSLYSGAETLIERDGIELVQAELAKGSEFLDSLSGIDQSVYELSERFADADISMTIEDMGNGNVICTVGNMAELEGEFERLEVFAEVMNGNTRTTELMRTCSRLEDGDYQAIFPAEQLDKEKQYTFHIYALTDDGRMQLGGDYAYQRQEE